METYTTYIVSIGGIISIMILWIMVQQLWKSTFSEELNDEDPLADRSSCGNCGCTTICSKHRDL